MSDLELIVDDKALSVGEQARLGELENVIKDNFLSFMKVGSALREIRESRLYREKYDNWKDYCRDLWDVSRRHADELIGAADVIDNLGAIAPTLKLGSDEIPLPKNESQARPLTKLKNPEQQAEAWIEAINTAPDGKVTAKLVKNAVKKISGENTSRKLKKIRKKISKEQRASLEFKQAVSQLLTIIIEERKGGWKSTSKESANIHIEALMDAINEE